MEFIVEQSNRLDKFLTEKILGLSRSNWQKAIQGGAVKINGHFAPKQGFKLKKGDIVEVIEKKLIFPKSKFEIEPQNIPLKIIYEDKDILVIDKPVGLIVHPTQKEHLNTLVNALLYKYPNIKGVGEDALRPGIVHRLDRETSGLLIVAKNQKAFLQMKEQFLNRTIIKKYLALVEGVPKEKKGIIDYAIKPSKYYRLKKVVVKPSFAKATAGKKEELPSKSIRAAKTHYKVIKNFGDRFALVEAEPKTGRTHQIRVHLASIGHPIVGDVLYGAKEKFKATAGRHFLHAYYLKFILPPKENKFPTGQASGAPIALEIGLPEDFEEMISRLSK
ncbi:MAG: Pseudouridine synthase [Candidatus Wolfebacteria bacterium GW2011_GWC1_37_10]|uniref:Pseudouridine synthase n=1 Tax=Candidatus Wolfebacteria bacterium GW2011_GWC1_37_10 TaxID=1619010 RepID=A0A0G0G8G5_9BACT|nr:MAG: Pseudouridine synthase [Candidatus Wolfebacteria bacterium GW2011_GWC1_37_10]